MPQGFVRRIFILLSFIFVWLGTTAFTLFPPIIVIDDVTVIEGDTGTTIAQFQVRVIRLSETDSCDTVTVDYATSNGSALAGFDYFARSGQLTFTTGVPCFT